MKPCNSPVVQKDERHRKRRHYCLRCYGSLPDEALICPQCKRGFGSHSTLLSYRSGMILSIAGQSIGNRKEKIYEVSVPLDRESARIRGKLYPGFTPGFPALPGASVSKNPVQGERFGSPGETGKELQWIEFYDTWHSLEPGREPEKGR